VTPSRKLPQTRMMTALFDWLDIDPRVRPKGIRTIARDFKRSRR